MSVMKIGSGKPGYGALIRPSESPSNRWQNQPWSFLDKTGTIYCRQTAVTKCM